MDNLSQAKANTVSGLLGHGAQSGIRLSELSTLIGMDERAVRRRIQAERRAGALILSDCEHGYFLPATADELRRFALSMRHRAREINAASQAAEVALAASFGQELVDGW